MTMKANTANASNFGAEGSFAVVSSRRKRVERTGKEVERKRMGAKGVDPHDALHTTQERAGMMPINMHWFIGLRFH